MLDVDMPARDVAVCDAMLPVRRIAVLYGTETGNSQDVAKRIGREAKSYGLEPAVQSLHVYDIQQLPTERLVVFVVATTGQGDVPDRMKSFWRFLFRKSLKADSLVGLRFAVFGLGDSAYFKFNVVAKKLHNRLCSLGAEKLCDRGLGDDQADAGYETELDPWLMHLWTLLTDQLSLTDLQGPRDFEDAPFRATVMETLDDTRPGDEAAWFQDSIEAARLFIQMEEPCESQIDKHEGFHQHRPFLARLKENRRITAPDHFQDTRHLVLDTKEAAFEYSPGDVLCIHPLTPWRSVDAFLNRLGIDPHCRLLIECSVSGERCECYARSLVQGLLDVDGASPRRFFFEVLSRVAKDENEKQRLSYLSSSQGREELTLYNRQSGRTVLEVLMDFPSCLPSLDWMLDSCPRKIPRKFSIASSPRAHVHEIHLTVAIVQYVTKARRLKRGLCTSFLASLKPGSDDALVPCWIEKGSLDFSHDSTSPLILIGPGTGVAPFRSVLAERHALHMEDSAYRPEPSYLFFGCRNQLGDFYYVDEWNALQRSNVLDKDNGLITAFSRDQKEKMYVTHRLREHGSLICNLLMHKGASVSVAGSANKMPRDVRNAILGALIECGKLSPTAAEEFLTRLEQTKRYQVESWT